VIVNCSRALFSLYTSHSADSHTKTVTVGRRLRLLTPGESVISANVDCEFALAGLVLYRSVVMGQFVSGGLTAKRSSEFSVDHKRSPLRFAYPRPRTSRSIEQRRQTSALFSWTALAFSDRSIGCCVVQNVPRRAVCHF
jgi:hypothetical protein